MGLCLSRERAWVLPEAVGFDYVVFTASTPKQREDYRRLVARRVEAGLYPVELKFRFYNDPETGRVGSGGGTLLALVQLFREEMGTIGGAADEQPAQIAAFYAEHRVLVLHAGGESRRLPCYVPEGKLFAPLNLPRSVCGAAVPPVVLDLLLLIYLRYPWSRGEVIMACGDLIADFDTGPLQIAALEGKYRRGNICGFGMEAPFAKGSHHGVFVFDNNAAQDGVPTLPVRDFHQKSPPDVLERECQLVGSPGNCAVDTGIFSLDSHWIEGFLAFGSAPQPGGRAPSVLSAVEASEMQFDFFLECVAASLPSQSCQNFVARMTQSGSKLSEAELSLMHEHLSSMSLRGALVCDALFLHFGTILEYPDSSTIALQRGMWPMYVPPGTVAEPVAEANAGECVCMINCSSAGEGVRVKRVPGEPSSSSMAWVENCKDSSLWLAPEGFNMIVGLDGIVLGEESPLPAGLCLDGRSWVEESEPGYCVAVYGSKDTFKAQKTEAAIVFCGKGVGEWLAERDLTVADIWGSLPSLDLWTARLFCVQDGVDAAAYSAKLKGYWDASCFDKAWFLEASRLSLQQLNAYDSALDREAQRMAFRS